MFLSTEIDPPLYLPNITLHFSLFSKFRSVVSLGERSRGIGTDGKNQVRRKFHLLGGVKVYETLKFKISIHLCTDLIKTSTSPPLGQTPGI